MRKIPKFYLLFLFPSFKPSILAPIQAPIYAFTPLLIITPAPLRIPV